MDEKVIITKSSMEAIGDAIRYKRDEETEYLPSEMPAAIRGIPNVYTLEDEGKVVSGGALVAQTARTPAITENGEYDTTGNNSVTVNVPTGSAPVLQSKTVTENGDYYPPTGVDGFSELHVNVQGGGGSSTGYLVDPSFQGLSYCYVISSGTAFWQDSNRNQYLNIFEVEANHTYILAVGSNIGVRRRAGFFPGMTYSQFEPYLLTPGSMSQIFDGGVWLAPYTQNSDDTGSGLIGRIIYTPSTNGVIVYGTDNAGNSCPAYCVDLNASGSGSTVIQPLSVTQNGVYGPPSGVDGFGPVTVNVQGGGGISGISAGTADPTTSYGSDGDIYIKYVDVGTAVYKHTYAAKVTKFMRGTSVLDYVSAAEIDLIFDDGNGGEVSIRDISDFSYWATNGNDTTRYTPTGTFDNNAGSFSEFNPVPVTWFMEATIPPAYTPKTLRVMQRDYNNGSDVWSSFTLSDTIPDSGASIEILSEENLQTTDWAGVRQWTDFACNGEKMEGKIPTDYFIKESGSWSEVTMGVAMSAILKKLT